MDRVPDVPAEANVKFCTQCKADLPFSEFTKDKKGKFGLNIYCKPCNKILFKAFYDKNQEKQKAKQALRRQTHPEQVKANYDEWYAANGLARSVRYRAENGDRIRANRRARYAKDPEKNIAETLARIAKRRGSPYGMHTVEEWRGLCAKFNHRCACCGGKKKLTRDHIVSIKHNGHDSIDNIQPLCQSCNSRKQDRHINYRFDRLLPAPPG